MARRQLARIRAHLIVVPIVQDEFQQIGVRARRDAVKEASGHDAATLCHAGPMQNIARIGDDVRLVKQGAARSGAAGEQGRQQRTVAAADIHDVAKPRKAAAREQIRGDPSFIARSKMALSSGERARKVQTSSPWTCPNAVSPVRTACSRCPMLARSAAASHS